MPQKARQKHPLRGFPWKAKFTTKQEADEYFSDPDGLQCLLCGRMLHTLNNHLQMVHGTTHEEYRTRYGLPWRRGLVSPKLSKHLREKVLKRISDGSFKPTPDNKAAVAGIRVGRRKDQPFLTATKAELGRRQSRSNIRYSDKDFEEVLSVMLKRKATLRQTCMAHKKLPPTSTVLRYAESEPAFRTKLLKTYHALPYPVQARAAMLSPQFFKELRGLRRKGLSALDIARKLKVSSKTVMRRLKQL
jgi:hypothetical protein